MVAGHPQVARATMGRCRQLWIVKRNRESRIEELPPFRTPPTWPENRLTHCMQIDGTEQDIGSAAFHSPCRIRQLSKLKESAMTNKSDKLPKSNHFEINLFGACLAAAFIPLVRDSAATIAPMPNPQERMIELTIESHKPYSDPFNDVDVDVIFSGYGEMWRVPTFWRGGQQWTVRFAPPRPGEYSYRLESTDKSNPDLNGHAARVKVTAYTGNSELLKRGMLQVSKNKRYFEQADGTPFYWLGDTWWTGLSDRLPWDGFQRLAADRKEKGFTVVQICAGLVPSDEELAPVDPGYSNEGGAVWDPEFKRINPQYFDYADRRIQHLIDVGIAPAIVGGWFRVLSQMGVAKMKKHWRYIIARYGAYPVFWVGGGEVYDPPEEPEENVRKGNPKSLDAFRTPGWTEVVRYIRATDPYRHPVSVHEISDVSLQDASLTDFDFAQPGHAGWSSIGGEVAQLNMRYARTAVTKPFVVAEIGYEMMGSTHLQDFQRVAFWLAMLNGAAGHSYGAAPTYEVNNPDKPLHRFGQYTFLSWEEGMRLPGAYQVGLGAKLLRKYAWWQFTPHPEWVTPHGTTLLEPRSGVNGYDLGDPASVVNADWSPTEEFMTRPETVFPGGEWGARHGNFRQPYAAGIPRQVRVVYIPYFGLFVPPPPTVLGLEKGVIYHAYYWEPMLGIRFDLGSVGVPEPGALILADRFDQSSTAVWSDHGSAKGRVEGGKLIASGETLSVVDGISAKDSVVAVDGRSDTGAGIVQRYQNVDNYVATVYSSKEKLLYVYTRSNGVNGRRLGVVSVTTLGADLRLSAEVRSNMATASLSDGINTYSTPIVDILGSTPWVDQPKSAIKAGAVGVFHLDDGFVQRFDNFEFRQSPIIAQDTNLDRKLYDARGVYRGELNGPRWSEFGMNKAILLNSYRPERFPSLEDWVLVLEAKK
jgi:hypothetical protein